MKLLLAIGVFLGSAMLAVVAPADAADAPAPGSGDKAPALVLKSVVDGKVESYDLQAAAAKRPVVLYFFPQAFSSG